MNKQHVPSYMTPFPGIHRTHSTRHDIPDYSLCVTRGGDVVKVVPYHEGETKRKAAKKVLYRDVTGSMKEYQIIVGGKINGIAVGPMAAHRDILFVVVRDGHKWSPGVSIDELGFSSERVREARNYISELGNKVVRACIEPPKPPEHRHNPWSPMYIKFAVDEGGVVRIPDPDRLRIARAKETDEVRRKKTAESIKDTARKSPDHPSNPAFIKDAVAAVESLDLPSNPVTPRRIPAYHTPKMDKPSAKGAVVIAEQQEPNRAKPAVPEPVNSAAPDSAPEKVRVNSSGRDYDLRVNTMPNGRFRVSASIDREVDASGLERMVTMLGNIIRATSR